MLSQIERGEGNPSRRTLRGIAAALGVSVSTLAKAEGIAPDRKTHLGGMGR